MTGRRRVAIWLGSGVASVLVHGGAFLALALAVAPDPVENQPVPKSRLTIESQKVDRVAAINQQTVADRAVESTATSARIDQGIVPQSTATPSTPDPDRLAATSTTGESIQLQTAAGRMLAAATSPITQALLVTAPPAELAQTAAVAKDVVTTISASPNRLPATTAVQLPPQPATTSVPQSGERTSAIAAQQVSAAAPVLPLPALSSTASVAWSVGGKDVADPVSLAAIQSFMQPQDVSAKSDPVRDGITGLIASVPCSRLQTTYIPETGMIELRGHIPENGLRDPVLAALRDQLGSAIPISDNLLILPRPQCGALSGIAAIGLPQSTEQLTNPRVVGPNGFAQNYNYSEGQRLTLSLTAPDYDGFVYVDYFTADGTVIHLQPNDIVPLAFAAAKSALTVGQNRDDKPFLEMTIAPPFGQEIAAAFAASVPLYQGLRPIEEPAASYLEFLKEQVTVARATHPDFKGEWVYFFISTSAR